MDIRGFLETSLIDWDGKISSVIFLPGCNMRCPFCHNAPLLFEPEKLKKFELKDIKQYLIDHKNWIDAVVISGGEPTIHGDLEALIKEIKDLGFLIKLDTNGTDPKMLKDLLVKGLIDYVAMDVKGPLNESYKKSAGAEVDLGDIRQSVDLLKNSGVEYELRTTVVPGFHTKEDVAEMAKQLSGSKKLVLQQFEPANCLDDSLREVKPYEKEKLIKMVDAAKQYIPNTVLRGA
jgi:pyruvate formate lyase activating enzyme